MPAPIITSKEETQGTATQPFQYQIEAENDPTAFSVNVLPTGLSLNTQSGLITGTPSVANSTVVTLTATNQFGSGTGKVQIKVNAAPSTGPATVTTNNVSSWSSVPASTNPVQFLPLNGHRVALMIFNKSTANLYLMVNDQVTLTKFTTIVPAGDYYEMPNTYFTDLITGVWDAADGNGFANVTEVSNSTLGIFNSGKFPY